MKALLLILSLSILSATAHSALPVRQSHTWKISEDKIYVSSNGELLWVLNHKCGKNITKTSDVSIRVNQSRVRENSMLRLVVNGNHQQCQVGKIHHFQ